MNDLSPRSFRYAEDAGVGTIRLDRPTVLNALTFEVYAELRDFLESLNARASVRAVVLSGAGRAFCSGGDVKEIIGELVALHRARDAEALLAFTRMTCDVVRNLRRLRKPVVAAVNGVACGAGAVIALACDFRVAAPEARFAFLFPKVGLSGADMGACWLLPRVVGLGRATELLLLGDFVPAEEAHRIGLVHRVVPLEKLEAEAGALARRLADGPAEALAATKEMLDREAILPFEEALEAEARRQADLMLHPDFLEAYEAGAAKRPPPLPAMTAFLDEDLRSLRARARAFAASEIEPLAAKEDGSDAAALECMRRLAASGLLRQVVPESCGGARPEVSFRALCVVREELAATYGLADILFAMQGLGSYAITLAAEESLKRRLLPAVASGGAVAAIAITETEAGSDAGAVACTARRLPGEYILEGTKTLITNAGVADFYTLLARTGPAPGSRGLTAFLVEREAPGFSVARRQEVIAPHPIGELSLHDCRIPAAHRLGPEGEGFRLMMRVLDGFRPTVGAAAVGIARRALAEALARAKARKQFGKPIAEFQGVQFPLAESGVELDAARLLVHRAAALLDAGTPRVTKESAAAKLFATEAAQRIVDRAVQIHGGLGVLRGSVVERLYREVRALRIYEGTSEILKGVLAGRLLEEGPGEG